jgi:hypothetical protein
MIGTKWEIGPVKLANGEEASIDAINEGQEGYRYTGRVRSRDGKLIASGWRSNGRYMYGQKNHPYNLAPPPKKTVRVKLWLMIWLDSNVTVYFHEDEAIAGAKKHGFAILPIDREVTEGKGL